MKKTIFLLLLLPTLVYSQNKDDYDIYSLVIDAKLKSSKIAGTETIAIDDSLRLGEGYITLEKLAENYKTDELSLAYESVPQSKIFSLLDTIIAGIGKNQPAELNTNRLVVNIPYKTIGKADREKLRKSKNYWDEYEKLYPDCFSIFLLSPIYYSDNLAAVYIATIFNPRWGRGFLYILEKEDKEWKIRIQKMVWMS